MSEATSTPAAPVSTPSAPAASAAPASAPAAVSAPASTPVAAPEAAPVVVATPEPAATSDAGKSTLQVMQEAQAKKEAEAAAAPTTEPVADVIPPAAEKTPEQVAEEAAAAVVEEPAKPAADDDLPNFDDFDLDPIALAPKELASKIDTDAALSAALDANPELKNEIFGNARLAAETAAFKEIVGSPQEAKVAVEGHATFMGISSAMSAIQDSDVKTLNPVMDEMLKASAIRNEAGELQYDQNGALVTNGMVGKFLRNSFKQRLELFADQFVKANDEEGQAAIDILMERAGLRAPSSPNEEEMSAEMRTQHESIKAERAALDREKQERATEVSKAYNTTVNTRIDAMMDSGIGSLLSRATGLNDFSRKTVESNIRKDLATEISKNPRFQAEMDDLDRLPYGTDRQQKHMALATRYFQTGLAKVATVRLAEAGAALTAKQQAQADKSAARAEAARSETRGALPVAKTAPVLNAHEQFAKVESDLRTTLGRAPSTLEVLAENLKRKTQTAA